MSNLTIDIKPSGGSSFGKAKEWLTAQIASEVKVDVFNKNLDVFAKDWKVATASIFAKRSYKDYDSVMTVKHMVSNNTKILGINVTTHRTLATIELKVRSNKLGSFIHSSKLEPVQEFAAHGERSYLVTRVAILRSKRQVPSISFKSKSAYFANTRDSLSPKHKGRLKGFITKKDKNKIFIRMQAHTWRKISKGVYQRLPIAEMYGIPDAYLLNSIRTKKAFNFDQRIKDLWKP